MSFMVQGGYEFLKKDKGKLISKNINDFTVHILEYVSCIFPTVLSGTVQEINPTHLYMWFHNFLIYVTLILVFMYASLIGIFSLNQCTCDYLFR